MRKMKTFIKWFGNKSRYRDIIISLFPTEFDTYIEPFIGSGAVFLQIQPKKWIISDINTDLINIWVYIKKSLLKFLNKIEEFSKPFITMPKHQKLSLCRSITEKLQKMRYGPTRAAYYLLMKYCVFFGSIIKNNKYYFRGLDLNFMNPNYIPVFSKESFKLNLTRLHKFMNESTGTILNLDYKQVINLEKKGISYLWILHTLKNTLMTLNTTLIMKPTNHQIYCSSAFTLINEM